MKRLCTLLAAAAFFVTAMAQQLKVNSFGANTIDLTASTQMRRDANNEPCALVKVVLCAPDATFEGNIVGDTRLHTNEYWVYMTGGSKFLNVKVPVAKPLLVRFPDYGVDGLMPKTTYVLDLELPQQPAQSVAAQQQVFINFSPATAMVVVNGKMLDTSGGTASTTLPADKEYSYMVAAKGYESSEGTFRLKSTAPTRLNIQLYPEATQPAPQPTVASTPVSTATTTPVTTPQPTVDPAAIRREAQKAYNDKNYTRCMELCLQISNDPWAQFKIGYMYDVGKGIQQDYKEAANWYRKAADKNYTTAQYNLGYLYQYGQGVQQDYKEAMYWYRKAAEQNDADSQFKLGYMYYHGKGVQQNYKEAVYWFRKAAEQNDADSQNYLGERYYYGEGVTKNYREAAYWYRKAAEQDHKNAMYNYGYSLYYGQGVAENRQEAYKWLKKAADKGNASAQKFISEHSF